MKEDSLSDWKTMADIKQIAPLKPIAADGIPTIFKLLSGVAAQGLYHLPMGADIVKAGVSSRGYSTFEEEILKIKTAMKCNAKETAEKILECLDIIQESAEELEENPDETQVEELSARIYSANQDIIKIMNAFSVSDAEYRKKLKAMPRKKFI